MIKLMPMGDFFYEQFKFADKFNLLHLSDAELALLSAVMILNPGQYRSLRHCAVCLYEIVLQIVLP